MKIEKLSLLDSTGGLNDRDLASALDPNEFQTLENYFTDGKGYLQKRPGKEIVQYAPINPQPFVSDSSTLFLYHLDETGSPYIDSGPNSFNLGVKGTSAAVPGIFSNGQRLSPADALTDGSVLYVNVNPSYMDRKTAICYEGWVNLDPDFGLSPVTIARAGNSYVVGNSGACLVGISIKGGAAGPIDFYQGITAHRDLDPITGKPTSGPYFKFTIRTLGSIGVATIIKSLEVPTGVILHVRGVYDSNTGLSTLEINGSLQATGVPPGGGLTDAYNNGGSGISITVGGSYNGAYTGFTKNLYNTIKGFVDEVRISSINQTAVNGFPFEEPRGMGFEFSGSDGTRQAVVSAKDKLWYTLGDGNWTQMKMYGDAFLAQGFSTPLFSTVAYWDAIFRKDILYLANGTDSPLAWDGSTLVSWMGPITAPVLSISATIGTITPGVHMVAYSYLYGSYETALSPLATVDNTATGGQINASSIPPRHANCTGVRVYMSKAGGTTLYLARQIAHTPGSLVSLSGPYVAGSPTPSFTTDGGALGPADASLSTVNYPTVEAQVATALSANPQYLLAEHDRAFICGMLNDRYTLRWTELGAFDVITVFSFAQAAANQGNLIAIASYYGEVHLSKDGRATLILRGSNPQNWRVLETLHPSVGAVDHWSYVHRYPWGDDNYVLCFAARDGFYKYAGQQIVCISDKIFGTIKRLSSGNATRNEWDVTTGYQFQNQASLLSGGSATANIQTASYETDGLRENSGTAEIVNELNYLGLWNAGSPVPLVTGNVIAVSKGMLEGQFYFSNDTIGDTSLYYTTDNFVTVTAIATTLLPGEKIIEITKQGVNDFYFLITDSANADGKSSGGGNIYTVSDPSGSGGIGPIFTKLTSAPLFYDLDIAVQMIGGTVASGRNGRSIGNEVTVSGGVSTDSPNSAFINHPQTIAMTISTVHGSDLADPVTKAISSSASISAPGNTSVFLYTDKRGTLTTVDNVLLASGFYCFSASAFYATLAGTQIDISLLQVQYTRREFPLWRGGTFRPQSYWDGVNNRLVFLASTPEVNGNRTTNLQTITTAGVIANKYVANNVSAFTTDGKNIYLWQVGIIAGTAGFTGNIVKTTLANPATGLQFGVYYTNVSALRISYNSANLTGFILTEKVFDSGVQEVWTYRSALSFMPLNFLNPPQLLSLVANGDSGPILAEVAVQTTAPFSWYVAVDKITVASFYTVPALANVATVFKVSPYFSPNALSAATGILSNLLFMPSSGSGLAGASGNLWADRLYWQAGVVSGRFVQLGVPGNWVIVGVLESEQHNLGVFNAFDDFAAGFDNHNNSNGLLFELRNAPDKTSLALASYKQQNPNTKILGFSPVAAYVQWRITFTWVYVVAAPIVTGSPSVDFVDVGFFLGQANLPRTIGFHWQGRTFWTCAEDGAMQNNMVLVYQKNNGWMKIYGWNLKSIFRFRNQMVGLEAYQIERLMSGRTDAGAQIVGRARTGAITGFVDKIISRVQANVASFANNLYSSLAGYVKVTPCQGNTALDASAWVIPVPTGPDEETHRVLGVPSVAFTYPWTRALSIEIKTSTDVSGSWVPSLIQLEDLQQIDLELEVTEDAYDIQVN